MLGTDVLHVMLECSVKVEGLERVIDGDVNDCTAMSPVAGIEVGVFAPPPPEILSGTSKRGDAFALDLLLDNALGVGLSPHPKL